MTILEAIRVNPELIEIHARLTQLRAAFDAIPIERRNGGPL